MSAFICSDRQFAVIAKWLASSPSRQQTIADTLKRENIKSVNWRYKESNRFRKVNLNSCTLGDLDLFTVNDIFALLSCVDYQSCEPTDYDDTIYALAADLLLARGAVPCRSKYWSI